jgi:selenocysteine-specific elongation factor
MFVIGTAGHVDHGKSALVRALTGIDPDRLQEEKDRGMTIDLGFAWLKLPDGTEASIVDVPGHEPFIKNMLAGVGGIDLALLVIAADEGVMPQTREHLAILDLLGVNRGILVLTKCDLVDDEWLDLVAGDVLTAVEGTTLEDAPLVRCSAVARTGLPDLIEQIQTALAATPPKRDLGRPRLPIDRVFTIAGFGTVVTGTLIDGTFSLGQAMEVVPGSEAGHSVRLETRIRSLQTHSSRVETALPGTRTAANLAGLEPEQLHRGQVVTLPGWLEPSVAVDVRLKALGSLRRPLRHNLNVTFHSLAAEAPARLRLLEVDTLAPGDETWAQIRLTEPLAVLKGDRFILRDANTTVGGGTIVETQARRHARKRQAVLAQLESSQSSDVAEAILAAVAVSEPAELRALTAKSDHPRDVVLGALEGLASEGRVIILGEGEGRIAYSKAGFDRLAERFAAAVKQYLESNPLRPGMPKEELRSRLRLEARAFAPILQAVLASGTLAERGPYLVPSDWQPALNPAQRAAADAYLAELAAKPFAPEPGPRPPDEVVAFLISEGAIVDVGNDVIFTAAAYEEMRDRIVAHIRERGAVTLGEVRDLLGTSRRYVQPLLEYLDRQRLTVRRGDIRELRT